MTTKQKTTNKKKRKNNENIPQNNNVYLNSTNVLPYRFPVAVIPDFSERIPRHVQNARKINSQSKVEIVGLSFKHAILAARLHLSSTLS